MWQNNPYAWPLLIAGCVCLGLSAQAWQRRNVAGGQHLSLMMLAVSVWALAYALELYRADLAAQFFLTQVEYFGVMFVPALWVTFVARYTNQTTWLYTVWGRVALMLPPTLGLLCVWLPPLQPLMWTGYTQTRLGEQVLFASIKGPVFYTIVIGYSYTTLIAGTCFLVQALRNTTPLYRRQIFIMLLGSLIPWVANILYVSGLSPFGVLDLTPFAFTLTGAVISYGLFRYSLLDIVPVARESLFEHITEGVLVLDGQGRVLLANPAAHHILSLRGDVTGLPEALVFAGWVALADSPVGVQEYALPSGLAAFEVRRSPIYDRVGRLLGQLVLLSDVTARRHYEAQLRQTRDEARAANLAKSQFLATVSHELRTPLTVILGYTEILLEAAQRGTPVQNTRQLTQIDGAAHQLLQLVDDVLDFVQIESGRFELRLSVFAVDDLLAEITAQTTPWFAPNGNQFQVEVAEQLGAMSTDPVRLRQILSNLLSNAAKFTHQGQVWLRARAWGEAAQPGVVFEVQDTGIGIPLEKQAQLFQPFMQADATATRKYGGLGLGLVTTHRLCVLLGGEITCTSTPGVGTTFTVRLPRTAPTTK